MSPHGTDYRQPDSATLLHYADAALDDTPPPPLTWHERLGFSWWSPFAVGVLVGIAIVLLVRGSR